MRTVSEIQDLIHDLIRLRVKEVVVWRPTRCRVLEHVHLPGAKCVRPIWRLITTQAEEDINGSGR